MLWLVRSVDEIRSLTVASSEKRSPGPGTRSLITGFRFHRSSMTKFGVGGLGLRNPPFLR